MKITSTLFFLFIVLSCGPATSEKTRATEESVVTVEKPMSSEDPCAKFVDSKKGTQALDNYVIYRDFLKSDDYVGAFSYWEQVFQYAPAADGQRKTVFEDGIKFQERFFEEAKDETTKATHVSEVMKLYDRMAQCYPETSYIDGRKAFDYYYKYRKYTNDEDLLNLIEKSFKKNGNKVPAFVVNPFTGLMTEMFLTEKLEMSKAQEYEKMISEAIRFNLEDCEDDECDSWAIVKSYAPGRLESLEAVKGFYDCDYFKAKYIPLWEENPEDCDETRNMLGRLNYAGCQEEDPTVQRLLEAVRQNCKTVNQNMRDAYDFLQNGKYQKAIDAFFGGSRNQSRSGKKSKIHPTSCKSLLRSSQEFPKSQKTSARCSEIQGKLGRSLHPHWKTLCLQWSFVWSWQRI